LEIAFKHRLWEVLLISFFEKNHLKAA